MHHYTRLHEQYGEVVRTAPNELSYTSDYAWTDIYGFRHGHAEMPKARMNIGGGLGDSIINADRAGHQRMRRLLAHAFSDKALREQLPLIQSYVDLLIQKLRETNGHPTDIVSWYNFTTFDLVGDLAFGEPFDCLKDSDYKPWVSLIMESIKISALAVAVIQIFGTKFRMLLPTILPESLLEKRKAHIALTKEKVAKRVQDGTSRPDFVSYILKHNDEKGLTHRELEANAEILIIAGSETTATLLSGATYHLLRNPRVMAKLLDEVRSSFSKEEDINLEGVNRLQYMLAVLDESLRMYPPVPGNLSRAVPEGGDMVGGKWVPPGVCPDLFQTALDFSNIIQARYLPIWALAADFTCVLTDTSSRLPVGGFPLQNQLQGSQRFRS